MMKGLWILVFCLTAAILPATGIAQITLPPRHVQPPLGKDTLCFRYQFSKGDTLLYHIEAADSIAIVGDPVLLRLRIETLRVVCDSVPAPGIYHLTLQTIQAREKTIAGSDSSVRTTHPWVHRISHLVIDSLGHRLAAWNSQPDIALLSPGGAFQPLYFPPIDTSCGRQNQGWLFADTIALAEFGTPYPVASMMWLWRVQDKVDTLGKTFNQIQYTQSGIGSITLKAAETSLTTLCVMAGYGKLTFDTRTNALFHQFTTLENKLEISFDDGTSKEGKHHLMMNMHLITPQE